MDLSAISATLLGSSLLTGTDPERNVFDLIRTVVARQLAVSLSTQTERVYACIDVVKKGQHDFTVPIARLRLPGKADLLAQKAASEVREPVFISASDSRLMYNLHSLCRMR